MAKLLTSDDDDIAVRRGPAGRPFTDSLERCERKWTQLLAGKHYEDVPLKQALYTYVAPGLPAPAL